MKTSLTKTVPPAIPLREVLQAPVRVALAGQPNAGKTALFNRLTGARAHVANYPGVTVERRTASFNVGERRFEVLDLPGTYSLSSFSPEEQVAKEELLQNPPDVVVVVVDSTTLERSLVLLAQVLLLNLRTILCLNMSDEARQGGQQIDLAQMSRLLGIPVVETEGHRGVGVLELQTQIALAADRIHPRIAAGSDDSSDGIGLWASARAGRPDSAHRVVLGADLTSALERIAALLPASDHRVWIALRLLQRDSTFEVLEELRGQAGREALAEAARARVALEASTGRDIDLLVSERLGAFVDGLLREVVRRPRRHDARALSDRLDAVLAHQWLGLPVFGFVMYLIFLTTFRLGEIPMGWIESGFEGLSGWIDGFWPAGDAPLRSLLVDGLIHGVGGVIVFLPNILLLFFGLALLEDTGYMARAAHLVDHLMHRFGLHGKSFLPMLTGFGCNIPGIMATRTLENERDRLITMLILPLMSCGARLPIWMLLVPAFFPPAWQAPALMLIYATGIGLALGLAWLLRRTLLRGDEAPFVMELPPYRMPTLHGLLTKMHERAWLYLRKAGTIILAISILMWFITAYPKPDSYAIDRAIEAGRVRVVPVAGQSAQAGVESLTEAEVEARRASEALQASVAGHIGRAFEPLLQPIGFDWKLSTALVGAFAAKEVFVAQMGIVTSLSGDAESEAGLHNLRRTLARDYTPLQAVSLMLFLLIATPCMATVAVTRRESGRLRWALFQFFGLTAVAYCLCLLTYQIGRLWF